MQNNFVGLEKTAKGDVYLIAGLSEKFPVAITQNLQGTIFQAVKRNVTFDEYYQGVSHDQWLNDHYAESGYYPIIGDIFQNFEGSKAEAEMVEGIFILRGIDKKKVADAVRRHFGPGSALLYEVTCTECGAVMDHRGPGFYWCSNCHATKEI